jgi:hypothetical protein
VPLAALQWEGEHLRADLLVPTEGRLLWKVAQGIDIGVQGSVDGNVYGLGREGTLQGGRVRYSLAEAGPVLRYDLGHRVRISAAAGAFFLRRLEVEDADGTLIEDAALARGWRFGLAISWLLPKEGG